MVKPRREILSADPLNTLYEEDDVRPRATTDPVPIRPVRPAVSPLVPMLAGAISGFVMGAGLVGLAWAVLG